MSHEKPAGGVDGVKKIAIPARIPLVSAQGSAPVTKSMPPTKIMPLMALVTLIKGVCREGVTFQTTMYPTKQDNTKTVN